MLKDKTIVVIGGSGLIGRDIVNCCLAAGSQVIVGEPFTLLNHNYDTLEKIENFTVDVTDSESVGLFVKNIRNKYSIIDGVVYCAYPRNKTYGKYFEDVSLKSFNDNITKGIGGFFNICSNLIPLYGTNGGAFINISSVYGSKAPDFSIYDKTNMTMPVEYAAVKAAQIQLIKYLASYKRGSLIRFNSISPGGVFNDQPVEFVHKYNNKCTGKGMLSPTEVADLVVYLLSEKASSINGQDIIIDDGFTL